MLTRRRLLAGGSAFLALLALPFAWLRPKPKRVLRAVNPVFVDDLGRSHEVLPFRHPVGLSGVSYRPTVCEQSGHALKGRRCWEWRGHLDMDQVPKGRELLLVAMPGGKVWPNHVPADCRHVVMLDWVEDDVGPVTCGLPELVYVYQVA